MQKARFAFHAAEQSSYEDDVVAEIAKCENIPSDLLDAAALEYRAVRSRLSPTYMNRHGTFRNPVLPDLRTDSGRLAADCRGVHTVKVLQQRRQAFQVACHGELGRIWGPLQLLPACSALASQSVRQQWEPTQTCLGLRD